jgi:hypothetical protein
MPVNLVFLFISPFYSKLPLIRLRITVKEVLLRTNSLINVLIHRKHKD